jgi:hypothetical protein
LLTRVSLFMLIRGFRPVVISWITIPKAHISIAGVTRLPLDTSGA